MGWGGGGGSQLLAGTLPAGGVGRWSVQEVCLLLSFPPSSELSVIQHNEGSISVGPRGRCQPVGLLTVSWQGSIVLPRSTGTGFRSTLGA